MTALEDGLVEAGTADGDASALFAQVAIDPEELAGFIRAELDEEAQVSLARVIERHPLRYGLAELLAYLQVAGRWATVAVDEEVTEEVVWQAADEVCRRATIPRILLARP